MELKRMKDKNTCDGKRTKTACRAPRIAPVEGEFVEGTFGITGRGSLDDAITSRSTSCVATRMAPAR